MTIKAIVKCDGYNCDAEEELDIQEVTPCFHAEQHEWVQDPDNGYFHYCEKCWEKIEAELDEAADNE